MEADMTLVITPVQSHLFSLPLGFTMRPALMEDVDVVTDLLNDYSRYLLDVEMFRAKDILSDWSLPVFDMQACTRVVVAPDGRLVGYAELWDVTEPFVKKTLWARVHPAYLGLGIGSSLVAWAEEQSRSWIERSPQDARVVLHVSANVLDEKATGLFEQLNFDPIRTFWRMVIELQEEPQASVNPEGISIRPVSNRQEERMAITAVYESFQDHWGFVREPVEAYVNRWLYYIDHNDEYDPAFWFMAIDASAESGNQVAGVSLCYKRSFDDPAMGWVGSLGVRRPWRKRGLGLALLKHSFIELYRRGQHKIGLGVDSGSLTGATRLYEKAGMHSDPRFTMKLYEKELRSGVDLLTQSI
jgi:mycothiol synthase